MKILGLVIIVWAAVELFAPEAAWKMTVFFNGLAGRKSERTGLWETGRVVGAVALFLAGLFLLSMPEPGRPAAPPRQVDFGRRGGHERIGVYRDPKSAYYLYADRTYEQHIDAGGGRVHVHRGAWDYDYQRLIPAQEREPYILLNDVILLDMRRPGQPLEAVTRGGLSTQASSFEPA